MPGLRRPWTRNKSSPVPATGVNFWEPRPASASGRVPRVTHTASVQADLLHVVEPRAAGLDVHKLPVTASTRLCMLDGGEPLGATRKFRTTPAGLAEMNAWLLEQGVDAAAMEGTGIYWEPPFAAVESAGLRVSLLHAQQVKQLRGRKTDLNDSQ